MNDNKTKSNYLYIVIIILLIIALIVMYYFGFGNKSIKNTKKYDNLKRNYEVLENKYKLLLNNNKRKKCRFIRTLEVVDIINDYNGESNILLWEFQGSQLEIIHINNLKTKLVKGKSYEFTLEGYVNNDIYNENISNYRIIGIKGTDKVGLEQIQEMCE